MSIGHVIFAPIFRNDELCEEHPSSCSHIRTINLPIELYIPGDENRMLFGVRLANDLFMRW